MKKLSIVEICIEIAESHGNSEQEHPGISCGEKIADEIRSKFKPEIQGRWQREEEIELLREDAARYRFIRDSKNEYPMFFIAQRDPDNVVVQFTGEIADASIDEMMKTQPG